jgi:hypothetical protein
MQGIKGKRRRYENGIAIKGEHNYSQRLPPLQPKEEEKRKEKQYKAHRRPDTSQIQRKKKKQKED